MTDIERQILLNQIAILEALEPVTPDGAESTRALVRQRCRETAQLVREHSSSKR
jgi:hypothetical protein